MAEVLLQIKNLNVRFAKPVVKNINFAIERGQTVALVGESGSGKSVTAHSILQLFPYFSKHKVTGEVLFQKEPIVAEKVRGGQIGMIFQDPSHSLNPLHTIGQQLTEALALHSHLTPTQQYKRTHELLQLVGIRYAHHRLHAFPHELSGGECQRVMIAMAIANDPLLLIADEPTTALDVIIEAEILGLLKSIQKRLNMALLLITHNLKIVENIADWVCVLKAGEIVESKPAKELFKNPTHPYTQSLLANEQTARSPLKAQKPLLSAKNLSVSFAFKKGLFRKQVEELKAVDRVNFILHQGESLGIVGASGSGKSTLCFALLRLMKSQGEILFKDQPLHSLSQKTLRPLRQKIQIVFQNPFRSLNPRLSIEQIIEEGLSIHQKELSSAEKEQQVIEIIKTVGLDPEVRHHYPHEFSGGQRQRIAIARALILKPECLILDEPTSALDRITQKQIIDLLKKLQEQFGLAYLFISHDLSLVQSFCHRVLVMHHGQIIESGSPQELFTQPKHEYTQKLVKAAFEHVL